MRITPADTKRALENCYLNVGMHRDTERDILAEELGRFTAEWARACEKLDQWVLDLNAEQVEI